MVNMNNNVAPPVAAPPVSTTSAPELLRLPRAGERLYGLSRASVNTLILGNDPAVKSFVVRQRGKQRGIRLIVASSLMQYLRGVAAEQGVQL